MREDMRLDGEEPPDNSTTTTSGTSTNNTPSTNTATSSSGEAEESGVGSTIQDNDGESTAPVYTDAVDARPFPTLQSLNEPHSISTAINRIMTPRRTSIEQHVGNDEEETGQDSQHPIGQVLTDAPEEAIEGERNPDDSALDMETGPELDDTGTPQFPIAKLEHLDEMVIRPRWVIPVLPGGELETLLESCKALARLNRADERIPDCDRFYREGLTISFQKVLTDDAVNGWLHDIHKYIFDNCERLVDLIVIKLHNWSGYDETELCLPLWDLLAILLRPDNKFHTVNRDRFYDPSGAKGQAQPGEKPHVYGSSPDSRYPRGWLVSLIDRFGHAGGFELFREKFLNLISGRESTATTSSSEPDSAPASETLQSRVPPSINVISALLKPFGYCHDYLTPLTIESYLLPCLISTSKYLEQIDEEMLQKEAKNEVKNDSYSSVIKSFKHLAAHLPGQESLLRSVEMFRLKMILRLLQTSSFNVKMNALNEVNKVITNVSYYSTRATGAQSGGAIVNRGEGPVGAASSSEVEEGWLTWDQLAHWIKENGLLQIVLRDSLHQPQYVEKLEKILRFIIKERCLTLEDLDDIWSAQAGKHEAIVKNVHDLLAKLAWDFTPEQLDHLFDCFKRSWTTANKKQREKLLELIRRLAEDDKDGLMAYKVLNLLWNLAHSIDLPNEIMDQALTAHIKILDYSCSSDRDLQKDEWLNKCIAELHNDPSNHASWVLPALKHIREICCLYAEAPPNYQPPPSNQSTPSNSQSGVGISQGTSGQSSSSGRPTVTYRPDIIGRLQNTHSLVVLVSENLSLYINYAEGRATKYPNYNPNETFPGTRFSHVQEVQERLNFLRFVLRDGQLWLCKEQAEQIWKALAVRSVYTEDRQAAFQWFSLLMSDEPDLDPDIARVFFEDNIMKLDPTLVTEKGVECFNQFFKSVNLKENKLLLRRGVYYMKEMELIGMDYLWRIILAGGSGLDSVAKRAIDLLKETYANLDPRLKSHIVHEDFISLCMDRMRANYDTITVLLEEVQKGQDKTAERSIQTESRRIARVLQVLIEYIVQCDNEGSLERESLHHISNAPLGKCLKKALPMSRAYYGKHVTITVHFPAQFGASSNRTIDDMTIHTHTNDNIYNVKRLILNSLKTSNMRVDLYLNGEIDPIDKKLVSELPQSDKIVLNAKLVATSANMAPSPDSSSDSSTDSPSHPRLAPSANSDPGLETEMDSDQQLPGAIMANQQNCINLIFSIGDLGIKISDSLLYQSALELLQVIPPSVEIMNRIGSLCEEVSTAGSLGHVTSDQQLLNRFDVLFFGTSSMEIIYSLEIIYTLLMPSENPLAECALKFQMNFIRSGCGLKILELLVRNNFLSKADELTKMCASLVVLKIVKLLLVVISHVRIATSVDDDPSDLSTQEDHDENMDSGVSGETVRLRRALQQIPSPSSDLMTIKVARNVASQLSGSFSAGSRDPIMLTSLELTTLKYRPDLSVIRAVLFLAWCGATGTEHAFSFPLEKLHPYILSQTTKLPQNSLVEKNNHMMKTDPGDNERHDSCSSLVIYSVSRVALEVLTVMLMVTPTALDSLAAEPHWKTFVCDTVLCCLEKSIRTTAAEEIALMLTRCRGGDGWSPLVSTLTHLKDLLQNVVPQFYLSCKEFFSLFCSLLSAVSTDLDCQLPFIGELLQMELDILKNVRKYLTKNDEIEQNQLEGHLSITKHLVVLLTPEQRHEIGIEAAPSKPTAPKPVHSSSKPKSSPSPPPPLPPRGDNAIPPPIPPTLSPSLTSHVHSSFPSSSSQTPTSVLSSPPPGLVSILLNEYIYPSSRAMVFLNKASDLQLVNTQTSTAKTDSDGSPSKTPMLEALANVPLGEPLCDSPATLAASYDLLAALCLGCLPNLRLVIESVIELFYNPPYDQPLTEWEYSPPVGPRPPKGFVGLKNAGATCYMNSVLQQLYMIPEIRNGILSVPETATDLSENFSADTSESTWPAPNPASNSSEMSRKDYNIGVLKQIQAIFAHLALSKLQYYVPKGFWDHFRLLGEQVNLREQHDALEFFNSLVDSLDEGLKAYSRAPVMSRTLGGTFADQKICRDCPHRYSREESFTTLNIDIRNQSNLLDSLEQYVKGDLLEGANAYHCEKCDRKVDTVKRLCIKRLPELLTIQLKRFDYDWERETAIKFNDYFEFPRSLDMRPYTVAGLADLDGEVIDEELAYGTDPTLKNACTQYELQGIVVHSGQASGGHYYSYIQNTCVDETISDAHDAKTTARDSPQRHEPKLVKKWYKFDDGEVTECKLDDDEEMRNQTFGGDYMGEVFDHMLKKMSHRRQKRWWNAYILVYRRKDTESRLLNADRRISFSSLVSPVMVGNNRDGTSQIRIPPAIQLAVQRQNVCYMHLKNQFCSEYFTFIRQLLTSNGDYISESRSDAYVNGVNIAPGQIEEMSLLCTQIATHFLFYTCFRSKKSLRGQGIDWYEALQPHLRTSATVRSWFLNNALFNNTSRFGEYLLECQAADVRTAFGKILVLLAVDSLHDSLMEHGTDRQRCLAIVIEPKVPNSADHIMNSVLNLLKREVSEHSRHLTQYFNLFAMYASQGIYERAHLLRLSVASHFMSVALDEGPGPSIKYQYADLTKLYYVVSMLVRSCDVSSVCAAFQGSPPPQPTAAQIVSGATTSTDAVSQEPSPPVFLKPNPYACDVEEIEVNGKLQVKPNYIMTVPPQVVDLLYKRNNYIKKVIEDANTSENTMKLLQFTCWENATFSAFVLKDLLVQISYSYTYELRPFMDILVSLLLMQDSWQLQRIILALKGSQDGDERCDGLFDTIKRHQGHYQKRSYQCIKCLVSLFSNCPRALQILTNNAELRRRWTQSVSWLKTEMDRTPFVNAAVSGAASQSSTTTSGIESTNEDQFIGTWNEKGDSVLSDMTAKLRLTSDSTSTMKSNSNWSPTGPSNELSNGYFLERSNSARFTLERAYEIAVQTNVANQAQVAPQHVTSPGPVPGGAVAVDEIQAQTQSQAAGTESEPNSSCIANGQNPNSN